MGTLRGGSAPHSAHSVQSATGSLQAGRANGRGERAPPSRVAILYTFIRVASIVASFFTVHEWLTPTAVASHATLSGAGAQRGERAVSVYSAGVIADAIARSPI